jgi:hypothetical protein
VLFERRRVKWLIIVLVYCASRIGEILPASMLGNAAERSAGTCASAFAADRSNQFQEGHSVPFSAPTWIVPKVRGIIHPELPGID